MVTLKINDYIYYIIPIPNNAPALINSSSIYNKASNSVHPSSTFQRCKSPIDATTLILS